jgi:hypothetical protein
VLVKANGALFKLELFWFPVVPPVFGKSHANDDEVLTTLWLAEPAPHVQMTVSPALMLLVLGEKESLTTDTLAIAPKPESGQSKQGKNAVKMRAKYFFGENVMFILIL